MESRRQVVFQHNVERTLAAGTLILDYQRERDARVLPMYEFTCQLATLAPPPVETQQLFGAIHGNQAAMDAFVQMNAGTISPAEFFSPPNVARIMAEAQTAAAGR